MNNTTETREFKCFTCGATATAPVHGNGYNIGAVMAATKFKPLHDGIGGVDWLCPACFAEVAEHAMKIKAKLDPKNTGRYIHFSSLLLEEKHDEPAR